MKGVLHVFSQFEIPEDRFVVASKRADPARLRYIRDAKNRITIREIHIYQAIRILIIAIQYHDALMSLVIITCTGPSIRTISVYNIPVLFPLINKLIKRLPFEYC